MWTGSLQNYEKEPLGVKCKTCVKFLGTYTTYDVTNISRKKVQTEVEKSEKYNKSMEVKRIINLREGKYYKNTFISNNNDLSTSVIFTPYGVIKEFNSLIFRFLWNGNDKVIRLSTYAPYDQGGLKMLDYENKVKALRLSWLK